MRATSCVVSWSHVHWFAQNASLEWNPRACAKKMKNPSFAAAVNRDDIVRGASDFAVELDKHITVCIQALAGVANQLIG